MKRIVQILLITISLSITCKISAQDNRIDLEGVFTGKYRLDHLANLSWRPNSAQYSFIEHDTLFLVDAKNNKKSHFLTLNELKSATNKPDLATFATFSWISANELYFPSLQTILKKEKSAISVEKLDLEHCIDADFSHRLFIKKVDATVYVSSSYNNYKPILLCPDTGEHIVFGEPVHRSEWGINEGQYISPQGNFIAFYRMDESMVEDYPLVNTTLPIAAVEPMKYPMAGRTSHEVLVGIFDVTASVSANKPVFHYIKTDKNDGEFLTNVTFSPDEKFLYITHLNRAQNHAQLIEYEVVTGKKTRLLIEERDERYVEPSARPLFLKDGNFIWQSDRSGWNHCYLYDRAGKLLKPLTAGDWGIIELYGTDAAEEELFFLTNKGAATDRYLYAINIKSGKLRQLTPQAGTHTPKFSTDKRFFIDYFNNTTTPHNIYLTEAKTAKSRLLLESKNPYAEHQLATPQIFPIVNAHGDSLFCRLILPPNFDRTAKYPCLIYVYGGPHSQLVTNTFMSGGTFLYYMSQLGYVIFTLDNRGTAYRGAAFEKSIHRQLGVLEVEDQLCGVNYLKSLPFIDSTRLGLDGWSYGGFMTLSLITGYPTLFKAASCGGPVVDWRWYEVMYGERYMDTPAENAAGYEAAAILPKLKNVRCNLLVMHGAQDHTVVWQNTLELLRQAVEDGVQLDYFVYPNHDHNVRGIERVHLWKKLERFHELNLKNQ